MQAIILAAGNGEKIAPFNITRPKSMIPVGNKPIIHHILEGLSKTSIRDIIIVVGKLGKQIINYVEKIKENLNLNIKYVEQKYLSGTADALLTAEPYIKDDILLVYGDIILDKANFKEMLKFFQNNTIDGVVGYIKPKIEEYGFGLSLKEDNVKKIEWWGGSDGRVAGIYIFKKDLLNFVKINPGIMKDSTIGIMPPLESELNQSINDMINEKKKIKGFEIKGYYEDVDFPWQIIYANLKYYQFLSSTLKNIIIDEGGYVSEKARIKAPIYVGKNSYIGDNVLITKPLFLGKNTRIDNGATVDGGIIGDDTVIENYSYTRAVIGNNVKIGHGAEVFGVVFDKVYIIHYSEVAGVIGENTDIGAATVVGTWRFDSEKQVISVKGKKFIGESVAYIGDYCRTGVNAILMPGVRVGPYSIVGPGVILYKDLPPYKMILAKQEYVEKDWGPNKYGW